ncbi:MAG: hypothetical protein GX187_02955 [Clostridiaceae bacterium]|nr:hypothetical protein [Clostridiaceae bacterium]
MKWLSRLERRYGRYAISNLTMYIAVMNIAVVFLSYILFGGSVYNTVYSLALLPDKVLQGQVWRLVTFIFLPDTYSLIWIFFAAYLTYIIGASLERYWGSFRLNVYFFTGVIGSIIAAFITGAGYTGYYLNLSLFLAFATLFPDYELLLFFILPVKVKWLGLINAFYLISLIIRYALSKNWQLAAAVLVAVINYLVFFGGDFINWVKMKRQVARNRKRFFDQVNSYRNNRYY